MPDAPSLRVNGRTYPNWEEIPQITMSLETMPDTFEMKATTPYLDIPAGAKCEILLSSDLVLTGKLEKPKWHRGSDGRSFSVSGRSLPGDAVDCSAQPGTYDGLDLATLGETLCAPYDIRVRCDFEAPMISRVKVTPGQKVFEVLEKQARAQALIWTCSPAGELVLDKPGRVKSGTLLACPAIQSIDTDLDMTKRYDHIEVRGQVAGDESTWGLDAHSIATVTDPSLQGKRRLILSAPNKATAQQCIDRANVEAAARFGKSATVTVTLSSWRQDDGTVWRPGPLVHAREEWWGLDTDLIVRSVTLGYTAQTGTTCSLGLTLPQAYIFDRIVKTDVGKGLARFWPELRGQF